MKPNTFGKNYPRTLDRLVGRNPRLAAKLDAVRAQLGDTWDQSSELARRSRTLRYADWVIAPSDTATPECLDVIAGNFDDLRDWLAKFCDDAFAGLTLEAALAAARGVVKPARGPAGGAASLAARWAVACGAFGETVPEAAAKHFRQAQADSAPARRQRSRAKNDLYGRAPDFLEAPSRASLPGMANVRCAPLPAALQERLVSITRGRSTQQVKNTFRGLPVSVITRAAAGMAINPTSRLAIEGELARLIGAL